MTKRERVVFVLRQDWRLKRLVRRYRAAIVGNFWTWMEVVGSLLDFVITLAVAVWRTVWIPFLPIIESAMSVWFACTATEEEWNKTIRHVYEMRQAEAGKETT